MTSHQRLKYTNNTEADLRLTVEPWANEYIIRPGQKVDFIVRGGAPDGVLEFEQLPEGLTIYGYEGCVISVMSGDRELEQSPQ